jgi:hypothetical protein
MAISLFSCDLVYCFPHLVYFINKIWQPWSVRLNSFALFELYCCLLIISSGKEILKKAQKKTIEAFSQKKNFFLVETLNSCVSMEVFNSWSPLDIDLSTI